MRPARAAWDSFMVALFFLARSLLVGFVASLLPTFFPNEPRGLCRGPRHAHLHRRSHVRFMSCISLVGPV